MDFKYVIIDRLMRDAYQSTIQIKAEFTVIIKPISLMKVTNVTRLFMNKLRRIKSLTRV